ncbi:unnamed protein product [Clonostachys rosea f. rosea IK726]|uniref:Alpha-1,6-mannosyltransferase HOC1 n=2 Tax=Bionectria ochroleuca TaxID=29856 RepID=A0A0B7JMB7_BIOOC|nr:unnamed protein product [Clonostachys rosea f. rosea IK726]
MTRRSWLVLVALSATTLLVVGHFTLIDLFPGDLLHRPSSANLSAIVEVPSKPFPKKIWQSWKDDSENPIERTIGYPHQWRAVNPDWRYERMTHANMDNYVRDKTDPAIADVFTSLHEPILRADLLRYILMLMEGGVWADIDVYPHQPISNWIPDEYQESVNLVVGIENDHHKRPIWPGSPYSVQLSQYIILAKPNHPVFQKLVDQVVDNLRSLLQSKPGGSQVTFEDVMSTTGPFAYTKVLMEYFSEKTGIQHNGDEFDRLNHPVLIGDVLVLPKDSFGWLSHENTHKKGDPSILVEHLFIASWRHGHSA